VCQLCQQSERLLRITQALDAVVAAVPPDEVSFDVLEGVVVFVDGDKEGRGIVCALTLASARFAVGYTAGEVACGGDRRPEPSTEVRGCGRGPRSTRPRSGG
jgi:hypothetical protein